MSFPSNGKGFLINETQCLIRCNRICGSCDSQRVSESLKTSHNLGDLLLTTAWNDDIIYRDTNAITNNERHKEMKWQVKNKARKSKKQPPASGHVAKHVGQHGKPNKLKSRLDIATTIVVEYTLTNTTKEKKQCSTFGTTAAFRLVSAMFQTLGVSSPMILEPCGGGKSLTCWPIKK